MIQLTGIPVTRMPSSAIRCRPWCTEHHAAGLCSMVSEAAAYGETTVTYTPDEGAVVWLLGTEQGLTLDGAEQLADALLTHVATVRAAERVSR